MPVIAGAVVGGIGAITSGVKAYRAHKQLKELQKQAMPNYSVSPEMQNAFNRAEGMTGRGFTPAEEAAFKANLAQSSNTSYRQSLDQSGGNMSQAILGGINSRNISALNQFAAQDAGQRRANIAYADQLAGQLQNQKNMATEQDIARRLEMERGYGKAVSENLNNLQSSVNYGLTMGLGSSDLGGMAGAFGKKANDPFAADSELPVSSYGIPQQPAVINPGYQPWSPSSGVMPQQNLMMTGGLYGNSFGLPQGYGPTGSQYAPYVNR